MGKKVIVNLQQFKFFRSKMDSAAQQYMKLCDNFLKGQNEKFKTDLEERQKKIYLVTQIVEKGTETRVLNFKSQFLNSHELMKKAIDTIEGISSLTDELRIITKDKEDIKRIQMTVQAAKNYQSAMEEYLKITDKNKKSSIETLLKRMDKNAAVLC